jgi:hypothetical protein
VTRYIGALPYCEPFALEIRTRWAKRGALPRSLTCPAFSGLAGCRGAFAHVGMLSRHRCSGASSKAANHPSSLSRIQPLHHCTARCFVRRPSSNLPSPPFVPRRLRSLSSPIMVCCSLVSVTASRAGRRVLRRRVQGRLWSQPRTSWLVRRGEWA